MGEPGQTYRMDETDRRRRSVSSWPASLLPTLTLLALLAGGAAAASTTSGVPAKGGPVVEMTVTTSK